MAKHEQSSAVDPGPFRKVVYIFEREGDAGGTFWLLVLDCGHHVFRPRHATTIASLFHPMSRKLAPKRTRCHYCGTGAETHDPAVTIRMLGGPI